MQAEILLTLRLQQKLFADPRRIALLKQIEQTGSISQGAKNAGISYKSAWDAINDMTLKHLAEHLPLDSLLGAISRFSLQTSARNQGGGPIIAGQEHIEILPGGDAPESRHHRAKWSTPWAERRSGGAGITQSPLDQHHA
ncbi:transcriptional regulator ModE domain protein [Enterobacter hormaechei subsp. xiangfangensis]|nr:transcriptional regulator ModE domain protein [Enterobacter hormaechei subsp. xiangfangensis]